MAKTTRTGKPSQNVLVRGWFSPYNIIGTDDFCLPPGDPLEPQYVADVKFTFHDGTGVEKYKPVLSAREYAVAQLLSESFSQRQTADELGISRRSVREHMKGIRRKLSKMVGG